MGHFKLKWCKNFSLRKFCDARLQIGDPYVYVYLGDNLWDWRFFRSIRIFAPARLPYALSYDHMVYIKSFIYIIAFISDWPYYRKRIHSLINRRWWPWSICFTWKLRKTLFYFFYFFNPESLIPIFFNTKAQLKNFNTKLFLIRIFLIRETQLNFLTWDLFNTKFFNTIFKTKWKRIVISILNFLIRFF